MELGHAYSVLVVSASAKFNESVRSLLPERFYWPVMVLADAAGARRELLENSYDLVVINTPLPDEFGTRLAQDICQHITLILTVYNLIYKTVLHQKFR